MDSPDSQVVRPLHSDGPLTLAIGKDAGTNAHQQPLKEGQPWWPSG